MTDKLIYKIISETGLQLLLATYYDGKYIGKSKGYYTKDRKRIEIYPYQMNYLPPKVNLRTWRLRDEIGWE